MSHDHRVTYYACGHIHSQCRCISGDKLIVTLPSRCPECASAVPATPTCADEHKDSDKPTLEELRAECIACLCESPTAGVTKENIDLLDAYAREVARRAYDSGWNVRDHEGEEHFSYGKDYEADMLRSLGLAEGEEGRRSR